MCVEGMWSVWLEHILTHKGIITGLDGVVTLQLSTGPVSVTLGTSWITNTIMVRHLHGLPWRSALHMFRL